MNKSAIIIGVITLVLFGACRDYESVAYTQPVEVEKYDGTFLEYLSDEASHLFNQKYDSMLVIINAVPGLKEQLEKTMSILPYLLYRMSVSNIHLTSSTPIANKRNRGKHFF